MTRGHSRLRLRRRLLMWSAPVVLVALLAAVKLISVAVAGHSATTNFAQRDADGLRSDVSVLNVFNVLEPARAPFAAGALAVLEDRLAEADARFSEALARTPAKMSCPVRINLELVRERQGDVDAWENRPEAARAQYRSAQGVVADAPAGCFEGNSDPDAERRAVRDDAAPRLAAKLAGVTAPPPPPPAPQLAPPPPPPPPAVAAPELDAPPPLRLNPQSGDPLDKLRQVLQDAAG